MERNNSTLQPQPMEHQEKESIIVHYEHSPGYAPISIAIIVLIALIWVLVWNWRRHKEAKDEQLGFIQSKYPLFTDTCLLLWGLGSGYGIVFAVKSPFYELLQISATVGIIFKGVGAILVGFAIGFIHVYYESENDYLTVSKKLSKMNMIRYDFDHDKTKIISCDFKDVFLVLWSLGSGYGIIFAVESWILEIMGIKSITSCWIKPYVAILIGFSIGCIHFYYDILQKRLLEFKTYKRVGNNKILDEESDLDDDFSDVDKKESDLYDDITLMDTDEKYGIEITAFSQHSRLERTSTIEEFSEFPDDKELKRSKTYVPKKAYWKRADRLNTM